MADRPNLKFGQRGQILRCPKCDGFLHVGIVKGWYVFHCDACKKLFWHAECKQYNVQFEVSSWKKGDTDNDQNEDHWGYP